MLISELITKLESVMGAHGDLPVATMMTRNNYPYDGDSTEYESCKLDYLSVDTITFEDSEYDHVKAASRPFGGASAWTKVPRSGLHLVIDAT